MFSRDGAYIRSLGKLGQGPGETNTILGFSATDSLVYVKAAYRSGFLYIGYMIINLFKDSSVQRF